MNAFASATYTRTDGTVIDYYAPAFDLRAYSADDAIMVARDESWAPSVPWMPFITDDGIAGYARAFARICDHGHTAIICTAVSAYRADGHKINRVAERLSIDVNPDTAIADVWEGMAKAIAGFLYNAGGVPTEMDPVDLYNLARTLRG